MQPTQKVKESYTSFSHKIFKIMSRTWWCILTIITLGEWGGRIVSSSLPCAVKGDPTQKKETSQFSPKF